MKQYKILVAYDISTKTPEGIKRLRDIAVICLGYGQSVQKSLFECNLTEVQFEDFKHLLLDCIEEQEDNLRIYRLSSFGEIWIYGVQSEIDLSGPLVL